MPAIAKAMPRQPTSDAASSHEALREPDVDQVLDMENAEALHQSMWMDSGEASGFYRMGLRERERKAKAAARAASVSSMRTVEENSTLPPDNEMEVDEDASNATAASAAATSSTAASAAETSTESTLRVVLSVRGTSREPKGAGSGTALPGGPVPEGDSEVPQSMKRKGKEELKAADVNPSGEALPPGPLSLGSSSSQGVDPWNWQEYDKTQSKKQKQPAASTCTTRAPTREASLQPASGAMTP
eukprot:1055289-Amphidinium_carterae.2